MYNLSPRLIMSSLCVAVSFCMFPSKVHCSMMVKWNCEVYGMSCVFVMLFNVKSAN